MILVAVGSFVSLPAGLDPGSDLNLDYLGLSCSLLDPHTSHQSRSSVSCLSKHKPANLAVLTATDEALISLYIYV